jgi:chromosome segregation ATPase
LYSIGSFDSRFGVGVSQFKKDVAQAASVWNAALGKTILTYDAGGSLKINLIYDYREQTTLEQNKINTVISSDRATYDALKARYNALSQQYTQNKVSLQAKIDTYNQEMVLYNEQVASWNARGGAPPAEYEKLQTEKQALAAEVASLDLYRASFNQLAETLNSLVPELNHLAQILNLNVKAYNTVGTSAGEQFDEGEYVEDASGTRINVYQFNNEGQLVRVLEHELGHALGLGHVIDPKAIMYYLNEGTNEKLTASDISELKAICNSMGV